MPSSRTFEHHLVVIYHENKQDPRKKGEKKTELQNTKATD